MKERIEVKAIINGIEQSFLCFDMKEAHKMSNFILSNFINFGLESIKIGEDDIWNNL